MPKISHIRIIESPFAMKAASDRFDMDLEWVKKCGVEVERLSQDMTLSRSDSGRSIENPVSGPDSLPLVLVDGNVALSGRYPTREEIGIWMMFGLAFADDRNISGSRCCTL